MTALTDLLAALESGDSSAVLEFVDAIGHAHWTQFLAAYTGNTQAAIDFIGAVLPGWKWTVTNDAACLSMEQWVHVEGKPARALLIAAVKALVAKESGG